MKEEFDKWDLEFTGQLEQIDGRTLQPEKIHFGNKEVSYQVDNADWGQSLKYVLV